MKPIDQREENANGGIGDSFVYSSPMTNVMSAAI